MSKIDLMLIDFNKIARNLARYKRGNMSDKEHEEDYGLTTWDDVAPDAKKFDEPRANYKDILKLKNGNNIVRILTNPFIYWLHKYKADPDAKGYPDKIKCAKREGITCPLCALTDEQGNQVCKRKEQWYIGVIDRKTQSFKVVDVGPGLMQKLQGLRSDEEWGDLTQYDVNILVNEGAAPANYYNVLPRSKKPLDKADQAIKDSIDYESLRAKCVPSKPEWVAKRMMLQNGGKEVDSKVDATTTTKKEHAEVADDEYSFPSANE